MEIQKYEAMVKIALTKGEREWVRLWAEKRLPRYDALAEIDTSGVKPLISVLENSNALREDVPEKTFTREVLLCNAAERHNGYVRVPKTVEG
jgi:aspartyl/glutamyl-tRNA(Asn/Gln) amidotransferase C subunit